MALSLLEDKFGHLVPATRGHVEQLSMAELRGLALKIAAAASLAELGLPE